MPANDSTYDFEKMNFGKLLTAPLNACVDAQAQAATATSEYIQKVGFQYDAKEKVYKPVTFSFTYKTDEGEKRFTIPLISVVPIPFLQIRDVNINFFTELSVENGEQLIGKVSTNPLIRKLSTKNNPSETSEKEETSNFKSDIKVSINIKASSSDMPMGIIQLLQVMQNHITVKEINQETTKA